MKKSICETRFINDNPSNIDDFGPHKRLADAITELLHSDNEGGKAIGLEGTWGSGKSTIINFLESNLAKENDFLLFSFDAWAHKGDPLRRTFLESLINEVLKKSNWIDEKNWKKRLEIIAQRIRIEDKTTDVKLETWAKFLIFFLFIFPIGATLLSFGLKEVNDLIVFRWPAILGLVICLIPLVILIIGMIVEKRKKGSVDNAFAFFFQHSNTENKSETFQTINPTSIEFESDFCNLMAEALPNNTNRKIIIVLDNIDRIDSNDALELLATLQTYLQFPLSRKKDWIKNLWTIIPYDIDGIRSIWNNQNLSPNDANNLSSELASSFLDKRFQIRFEVPPVLLSDWSEYLSRKLSTAFPGHSINEFVDVVNVFRMFRKNPDNIPTPREIILYINQIASMHIQYHDKYPLSHYGYFVLERRQGNNVIQELRANKYENNRVINILGEDITKNLAAFSFNTDPDDAKQMLIRPVIEGCFEKGEVSELSKISSIPGFSYVLTSIEFPELIGGSGTRLENVILCLQDSGVFEKLQKDLQDQLKKNISNSIKTIINWPKLNNTAAKNFQRVTDFLQLPSDRCLWILNCISESKIKGFGEDQGIEMHEWIDGAIYFLNHLSLKFGEQYIESTHLKIQESGNEYLSACQYLFTKDQRYWKCFLPSSEQKYILQNLFNTFKSGEINIESVNILKVFLVQFGDELNMPILESITTRLDVRNSNSAEVVAACYESLWELKRYTSQADETLKLLATKGISLHFLSICKSNPQAAAFCLLSIFKYFAEYSSFSSIGNSADGRTHVSQLFAAHDPDSQTNIIFSKLVILFAEFDLPFSMLSDPNSENWVACILRLLINANKSESIFRNQYFSKYWTFITKNFTQDEIKQILAKSVENPKLMDSLKNDGFREDLVGLYNFVLILTKNAKKEILNFVIQGLKAMPEQRLQNCIETADEIYNLILTLVIIPGDLDLGPSYQEGLYLFGEKLIKGQIVSDQISPDIFRALPEYSRMALRKRLIELMKNSDGNINSQFFGFFGDELMKYKDIYKDSSLVIKLFNPIVKSRNDLGIAWITQLLIHYPSFFSPKYIQRADFMDMDDWIEKEQEKPTDNASNLLSELHILLFKKLNIK